MSASRNGVKFSRHTWLKRLLDSAHVVLRQKGTGMSDHKNAGRVVHPSGMYAVSYCKCGSVTIQVGEMSFRLTEESFFEFARTVGVGFEKISGESVLLLGEAELSNPQNSVGQTSKKRTRPKSSEDPEVFH